MSQFDVDTIDKQTLMLRLSINIYKMSDNQIEQLLTIFSRKEDGGGKSSKANPIFQSTAHGEALHRHMMIARLFVLIQQMDKAVLLERLHAFNNSDFRWSRDYPRMDCNLLVDFSVNGKAYRGYLRDISAGGLFIVTSENFQMDQEILLCFSLYESNEHLPFKIYGKVKRLFADGIGVQYHDITDHQQKTIHALIHKKIGA